MRLQAGRGDSMLAGDSEPAWASTVRLRLFNLNLDAEPAPPRRAGLELNMFCAGHVSGEKNLAPQRRSKSGRCTALVNCLDF